MRIRTTALAFLLGPVLSLQAGAQNLVTNPGFETTAISMDGWDISGGNDAPWGDTSSLAHSGEKSAVTACEEATCMDATSGSLLSQTITTVPGVTYSVSFWYRMPGAGSELQVLFGASPLTGGGAGTCTGSCIFQTTTVGSTWAQATATRVASSTTTQLSFVGRSQMRLMSLDDVSVVAIPTPTAAVAVPTLSQWALVGMAGLLAMFGLAGVRRRK